MASIRVKRGFSALLPEPKGEGKAGEQPHAPRHFGPGEHHGLDDETANHWWVRAHSTPIDAPAAEQPDADQPAQPGPITDGEGEQPAGEFDGPLDASPADAEAQARADDAAAAAGRRRAKA